MIFDRPDWMYDAACRGHDRDFFPRGAPGGGTTPGLAKHVARARAICAGCPVASDCLPWALTAGSGGGPAKFGVWAGYTPEELQTIARERRLAGVR